MRVQLYWAIAAVPSAVSDHYLRKQSGELGWIQFALRGPSLWAAALATTSASPDRAAVKQGWIDDQATYFTGRARLLHRAADRRPDRRWTDALVIVGFVVSILLLILELFALDHAANLPFIAGVNHVTHPYHTWMIVLAATLPAMAAFFSMSADLRHYEPHSHAYALMRRMFGRATDLATSAGQSDKVFKDIVLEIGREALAENAEWLVEHRHRTIEPR